MWVVENVHRVRVVRRSPRAPARGPEELWTALAGLVAAEPKARWLVDVAGIRLITSESLAAVVAALATVQDAGGRLALFGCQPAVRTVLATMNLQHMLATYPDLSAGMTALSATEG